jgi:hypothetical protein
MPQHDSFWHTHFGTDMLLSTWLMVISSCFYEILSLLYCLRNARSTDTDDESNYAVAYDAIIFVSATTFLFASCMFLHISYPENYRELMEKLATTDISKMSFTERYFTANSLLIATWSIFFGN